MRKKYKFKREILESYIVICNEDDSKNIATFKDGDGKANYVRVKRTIKMAFNKPKKEKKSQKNKYDRHIEDSLLDENTLYNRTFYKPQSIEEKVIENDTVITIIKEIWKLPIPQNRRVYMKLLDEFAYSQIARIEKVDRSVIIRC